MKRKDWVTLAGAVVFCLIILFANQVVAQENPSTLSVCTEYVVQKSEQKQKGKKKRVRVMVAYVVDARLGTFS